MYFELPAVGELICAEIPAVTSRNRKVRLYVLNEYCGKGQFVSLKITVSGVKYFAKIEKKYVFCNVTKNKDAEILQFLT